MPPAGKASLAAVVRWIEEDAEADIRDDPYRVAYRNADVLDAPLDAIDGIIRGHCGMARNDPRRMRFLLWMLLDERCRAGHSAVPYKEALAHLERRAACTREEARAAVQFVVIEGAVKGVRFGPRADRAALQLAPYARAEEEAAAWVVERLRRISDGV